jgi:uncharacterized membrane protein
VATSYPRIAGQSLDRLSGLSDGIFAVAMTLLVLDLRVPVSEVVHGEHPLWTHGSFGSERVALEALAHIAPRALPYVMSFMTLGIFWVGQQTQFNHFARADRHLTWIHLGFLAAVTLLPFSTGFLAEFATYRLPFLVYWLNLLVLGIVLRASLAYAARRGLIKPDAAGDVLVAQRRRIVFYQICYAAAMLLCVVNTYVSMVALVLLQLASAIAPPIPPFDRF